VQHQRFGSDQRLNRSQIQSVCRIKNEGRDWQTTKTGRVSRRCEPAVSRARKQTGYAPAGVPATQNNDLPFRHTYRMAHAREAA
jgi:hypothetical protein